VKKENELPEAGESKNPFERMVAISIAIIAVLLSLISTRGDNAKTEAILKTNDAANQWAFFQAKSIKESICRSENETLGLLGGSATDPQRLEVIRGRLASEVIRYQGEKNDIKSQAERLVKEAEQNNLINGVCDLATLILQVSIILCSVSIMCNWRPLWYCGLLVALIGTVFGIRAFLV
jgi:hypothetical protein